MYSYDWCLRLLEKVELTAARPQDYWDKLYNDLWEAGLPGTQFEIDREILKDLQYNKGRRLFNAWKLLIKSGATRPEPRYVIRFVHQFREITWMKRFQAAERELNFEGST